MDPAAVTALLRDVSASLHLQEPDRTPMRVWSMSGVERLTYPGGATAVLKYARGPFTHEDRNLRAADLAGLPVPRLLGSAQREGLLVMVIEDLGDPQGEPTDSDAAAAAAELHATPPPSALPVLDQQALADLPSRAVYHLRQLHAAGRWTLDTEDITDRLRALERAAAIRSTGALIAPFGWTHSEFHPSNVHVGPRGWHLLDLARCFNGPGLLDLASWQGLSLRHPPDRERLCALIEHYIAAGGASSARKDRGGLPPEAWALGWHRVWAVEWFLEQAHRWINDPARDAGSIQVVRHHLEAAVGLLNV
ncbi:aminoglycoside phosphotransferase family protein [Kitasatospora sp. GP82]|uniref:aminoglycoside phosphotransferase family protein n=1 Tax=Kitasatospora sp. GP82 TaxID=3035089 RepID=UPI00247484F5|nr:aminoglycoside phosphotransferase family protein [Kitasatospora sp. GP82]